MVIFDEHVNSAGVDLGAECTQIIYCVTPVSIRSVLEVPNLSRRSAVKPSSNRIILVIFDEHVNSAGVDLGAECTQIMYCVTPVFIRSVLEIPNLFRRSCWVGQS